MNFIALSAPLLLSGCVVIEHVQIAPTFDKQSEPGCCVLYAEVPPSTQISIAINKTSASTTVKLAAKAKF